MDGFNGEMLLDVEKRATDSLRPLNISISPPERNVSGRFFNFHDYKPTFKLDASEKRKGYSDWRSSYGSLYYGPISLSRLLHKRRG